MSGSPQPEGEPIENNDSRCESFFDAPVKSVVPAPDVEQFTQVIITKGDLLERAVGLNGFAEDRIKIMRAPDLGPYTTAAREALFAETNLFARRLFVQGSSEKISLGEFGTVEVKECPRTHLFLGPITERLDGDGESRYWLLLQAEDSTVHPELAAAVAPESVVYHDLDDPTAHNGNCVIVPFGPRSHRHS